MDEQQKTTDLWSYRVVVVGLTSALVLTVLGIIILHVFGMTIPSELTTIAVPILTALAAILTPLDSLGLGNKDSVKGAE
jgi:uncharacterized membrane protein